MPPKERIVWIDTAKGICIMLVVLHHVSLYMNIGYPFAGVFVAFRMPLYFILSGLFFKPYSGFWDFSIKKTNKLLIPYLFFYAVGGVILPILLFKILNIQVWSYSGYGLDAFKWIFSEKTICNPSIWFLFCLFQVNTIFYLVIKWLNQRDMAIVFTSLLIGSLSLSLCYFDIFLPYYLDSAFAVTPFFCFGWYLRNHTNFLTMALSPLMKAAIIIFCIITMGVIYFFSFGICSIISNHYGSLMGILQLYPYGILGTLAVLSLSHIMGLVPFVSYVGKYSIIILCTHVYFIQFSVSILNKYIQNSFLLLITSFLMALILNVAFIPLFCKWLPYVTAQKDLLKGKRIFSNKSQNSKDCTEKH